MVKHHRHLTLLAFLLTTFMFHADPGKRINEIKKDPTYIYGEVTKPTMDEAYDAALNILQFNIQKWYENKDKKNTGKTLRNMTLFADTIHAMRGEYHRIFAYIAIPKLEEAIRKDAEFEAMAREGFPIANVGSDTPKHEDPQMSIMLKALMEKTLLGDFSTMVVQYRNEGKISAASRDITLQTDGSYLAIFNKTKKGDTLLYLLTPGQGNRDDLVTGQKINPDLYFQHRDSYRFLWFVPSISNK